VYKREKKKFKVLCIKIFSVTRWSFNSWRANSQYPSTLYVKEYV